VENRKDVLHPLYTQDINLLLPRDRQELDRLFEGPLSHLQSPELSLQLQVPELEEILALSLRLS
jgi:hypothetical protein